MPDLSSRASHEFWKNYQDDMIYRVISFMESMEDWTLDSDPELEKAIQKLGQVLDNIGEIEIKLNIIRPTNIFFCSKIFHVKLSF